MQSNQIIAVWGNPSSGKTTTSIKLAKELSLNKKNVILVFCDTLCPTVMTVLPHMNIENKSLGSLLSVSEINQEEILSKCITLEKNQYISLLGYSQGENIFTYAEYSKERAVDFLILLRHLADYVIVDCSSSFAYDTLSAVALEMADSVVRLCSTNLKAVSYFSAYLPLLGDRKFNMNRHIKVLSNVKDNEPSEQIKEIYRGVKYEIPYNEELENQFLTGELFNELKSRNSIRYSDTLKELVAVLMEDNLNNNMNLAKVITPERKPIEKELSLFKKVLSLGKGGIRK